MALHIMGKESFQIKNICAIINDIKKGGLNMALALEDLLSNEYVSPYDELISYEYLYAQSGATLKQIVDATVMSHLLPREALIARFGMIPPDGIDDIEEYIDGKLGCFSLVINNTPSWPKRLKDSKRPSPVLYYRGDIGLLESQNISIVGARKATAEGKQRAAKLARDLVAADYVVTTGLAAGIDTAAAKSAIENGGRTIGVIGTPIDEHYPKENRSLQDEIANRHLLISQVPFYKYSIQPFKTKKYYFPERNELMAAISDATVIVEASDTSGTLTQARACLHQGRPLFIMRSCAENGSVSWPSRFINKDGVYILDSSEQLIAHLEKSESIHDGR